MFALRRAAVRAVAQPLRSISATHASKSFVTPRQISQPVLQRSFHQSWITRMADEKAEPISSEAESKAEPAVVEPTAEEQATEIKEESIAVDAQAQPSTDAAPERPSFPASNVPSKRIVYVGNLFFDVTTNQLETEFGRYGNITNCRVVTDFKGVSKGFGFVEFSSEDEAQRAVEGANQGVLQGRRMAVQLHTPRERRPDGDRDRRGPTDRRAGGFRREGRPFVPAPPGKTLFIGNMSFQMSDKDLNTLFRDISNVVDVRVAIDRRSGQPRGFAHAEFVDVESAQKAKQILEGKQVYGRGLRVDFSRNESNDAPRDRN